MTRFPSLAVRAAVLASLSGRGTLVRADPAAHPSDSSSVRAQAAVHVRDAWARATPAGARMGAIYLTIRSDQADRLTGAAVPRAIAGETQIHEVVTVVDSSGGDATPRMTMRQVAGLDLPAGEDVQLKPGGFHIMLIDLKKPLTAGEHVAVTLTLERAGRRQVTAVVRNE